MVPLNPPPNSPPMEPQSVCESRTAALLKRYGGLLLVLLLAAGVVIFWLASSRITGEVVVATGNQDTAALPDASVTIYSVNEDQRQRITNSLAKIQRENEQEKSTNANVFQNPSTDERTRSDLEGYNNLSDTKHCFALEGVLDEIRKTGTRKKNTDGEGRFKIWALPGKYLLEIVGQASNQRFEFIENVDLKWRSNLRLSEPSCRYSLTN
ncbi:MAG TPA: hypothetical protein VNH65_21075 [Candidatus Acidoferrum sp.]|nr:hypothetical protein [Candidatus Acidoferrum sp.]